MGKYYRFKTKTNLGILIVAFIMATALNFGPTKVTSQTVTPEKECNFDCGFVPCEPLGGTIEHSTGFPLPYKTTIYDIGPPTVQAIQCVDNIPAPLFIAINYLIFIWFGEVLLFFYSFISKRKGQI